MEDRSSSTTSITSPTSRPSPKLILAPGLAFFPGFTNVSQTSSAPRFKRSTSIFAPVSSFAPISLAGITFVSLITRQSPGFKSVAYSIVFRAKDKTLEEAEITAAMDRILSGLEELGIELRK